MSRRSKKVGVVIVKLLLREIGLSMVNYSLFVFGVGLCQECRGVYKNEPYYSW